ncbi:MAG TPA: NAD-dependent epimerase/dehydratase family protein, partial [Ktedonobacteraceae bacterium]|nr:NAD-dependent epimerase/dehydratase family protein [Ktedonobacteraceae bacterium]
MAEQLQQVTGGGDEVFLTGASGFIGSHVLRALLAAQYRVRALVRPGSRPLPPLDGCTAVEGDILRSGDLVQHMAGCRYLVHAAALYSFSPGTREKMFATNVRGCAGVLEAAHLAGIERAVLTSSSSTV